MIPFAFLSCCVLFSIFFFLLFIHSTLRSHAACSYNENATSAFSHAELIELFTPEGSSRERRIKEKCMRSHLCDIVRLWWWRWKCIKALRIAHKKKVQVCAWLILLDNFLALQISARALKKFKTSNKLNCRIDFDGVLNCSSDPRVLSLCRERPKSRYQCAAWRKTSGFYFFFFSVVYIECMLWLDQVNGITPRTLADLLISLKFIETFRNDDIEIEIIKKFLNSPSPCSRACMREREHTTAIQKELQEVIEGGS